MKSSEKSPTLKSIPFIVHSRRKVNSEIGRRQQAIAENRRQERAMGRGR